METSMHRFLRALGFVLVVAAPISAQQHHQQPLVTFESPTQCHNAHGVWRWAAKTTTDTPPSVIAEDHHVKPSDIAAWDAPDHQIGGHTPRYGREREWFMVTGRVVQVKVEEDGDLHVELCDSHNPRSVHVVVEIPVDHHDGQTPWNAIRKTIFGWSDQAFPFATRTGHRLHLTEHPIVQVVGLAFYDAEHETSKPNRRRTTEPVAVWEIHPVMVLKAYRDLAIR
jgi:hypothetical protein